MIKNIEFCAGEGRLRVNMLVTVTDEGIVAQVFGGERPHVGALALSIPRPGINNPEKISCSTTVVPLLGHKDDEVAKPVAEELAKKYGCPVVVVAGVHVENASAEEIGELVDNCRGAVKQLIGGLDPLI